MSVSASVHPTSGTQEPFVGSGAPPSGTEDSPHLPATGAARIQSNSPSPVKPAMPASPNTNHNITSAIPVGFVQEHKAGDNGLMQPQVPIQRTPEKNKDLMLGAPVAIKPTSNGVEGNEDPLAAPIPNTPVEMIGPEVGDVLASIQNHANETLPVAEIPVQQLGIVSTTVVEAPLPLPATDESLPSPAKDESPSTTVPVAPVADSPFETFNRFEDSVLENSNDTSPELAAPEPVRSLSPVNVPQLPTSTTDVPAATPVVAQVFVQESPPKVIPAATEVAKQLPDVPKPDFKVATPPRNSKRKKQTKNDVSVGVSLDRKSKRQRTPTQPYQIPLPEQTFMPKFKPVTKHEPQDKLRIFYKNEFLAVRNAEGGFYICQAMQNIYKSSARIRIRWLSQEKKDGSLTEVYTPDFYDFTDFDCILTNLALKKIDKNKYELPPDEKERTLNILNRSLNVEKGVTDDDPITEEHPDGLDLSLYRDEAQLKKKNKSKKAAKKDTTAGTDSSEGSSDSEEEESENDEDDAKMIKPKVDKKNLEKTKSPAKDKSTVKEKDSPKAELPVERDGGLERGTAAKRGSESLTRSPATKPSAEKKAKLVTTEKKAVATPPKQTRKSSTVLETPDNPIPTRSTKSRSLPKDTPKSSASTRTKERERRAVAVKAKERKLPVKRGKSDSD